jgi:hypothetical protein
MTPAGSARRIPIGRGGPSAAAPPRANTEDRLEALMSGARYEIAIDGFDLRAIPEWLWWTMFAGMLVVGWWLSLFPTDLEGFSLLLKTSVTIPADPIGWLLLLAGWSMIFLAVAVMGLGLFDRLAARKNVSKQVIPGSVGDERCP